MQPALLLAIYCLACVAFSLVGGLFPLFVRLTHRRMQIAISFVSGVMLGIGLLHLVPHSFALLHSIDATVLWLLAGFLFMFFLERFFHFHHHDAPQGNSDSHDEHAHEMLASNFSWRGAAIGLTLHGLVDGLAIAAAVAAENEHPLVTMAGLGTALAVTLHKPFDALTIGTLMAAAERSVAARQALNALYSLVTPLGVVLFYGVSVGLGPSFGGLGQALGFAAGAFVCIASSDLLPELQFHGHDRAKLSLALVAGIALAWATVFVEGGHDHSEHSQEPAHTHEAQHDHE